MFNKKKMNNQITSLYQVFIFPVLLLSFGCENLDTPADATGELYDKLTYHNDKQRTGWNPHETQLTPESVSGSALGQLWQTPQFDSVDGAEPRLFASPLYVDQLTLSSGLNQGKTVSVVFAATDVGYLYAVNATAVDDIAPGTILWSRRISEERPRGAGNLSTPVIDLERQRIYAVGNDGESPWRVYALDLSSGEHIENWPVALDSAAISAVNRNSGTAKFPSRRLLYQRSALNLNSDGSRLYVTFGESFGWIVSVDTHSASVASSFSSYPRDEEGNGGMWSSSGPSIDSDDYIHITTGANSAIKRRNVGIPGVFPDSEHNWGQSVIRLRDDLETGFELVGTYSPYNWAQAQVTDIDLGSSGAVVIDLDPATTSTPHLLVAGGKQGNVYLIDRENMPGSLVKRPAPSEDSETDGSLLAPDIQPIFGKQAPLNVFGPFTNLSAMMDQARSRTTAAYFKSETGKNYVFVTGSAKIGEKSDISTPPGLARLEIVTAPGQPAYLRIDQLEGTQMFMNPGSPIVTSNGGRDAIVWVLDNNVLRAAPLRGPNASRPVLYAFDALTLKPLWKSAPDELGSSGKYNEPTIARGVVYVGTDRIQAFGLLPSSQASHPTFPSPFATVQVAEKANVDPDVLQVGKTFVTQRCIICHASGQPGIPTLDMISQLEESRIVDALTSGPMVPQAVGLTKKTFSRRREGSKMAGSISDVQAIALYLNSLPAATKPAAAQPSESNAYVTGRAMYVQYCITCHMPDGSGVPSLQPALTDNAVVGGDPSELIRTVLHHPQTTGETDDFASAMSDTEAANLLTYIRLAFGENAGATGAIQSTDVTNQRQPKTVARP